MTPLRVVVLFGGRSPEHDISCATAAALVEGFDPQRFVVEAVGITADGDWVRADVPPGAERLAPQGEAVDPWTVVTEADVVFPVLHGPNGEDGTVQGLFEVADVPYVGAGVLGSAIGMDKAIAKELLGARGIPQVRHLTLTVDDVDGAAERVGAAVGWPAVVKPAAQGSSIGVGLAAGPDELPERLADAFGYGDVAVVEEFVAARELQCSVLGDRSPIPSAVAEVVTDKVLYDFDEKYGASDARVVLPADLPAGVTEEVQRLAVDTYRALRTEGMARVDLFLVDRDGPTVLVNEINTMPGVTARRIVPRLWEAAGLPLADLLGRLVDDALARHARRAASAADRPYEAS